LAALAAALPPHTGPPTRAHKTGGCPARTSPALPPPRGTQRGSSPHELAGATHSRFRPGSGQRAPPLNACMCFSFLPAGCAFGAPQSLQVHLAPLLRLPRPRIPAAAGQGRSIGGVSRQAACEWAHAGSRVPFGQRCPPTAAAAALVPPPPHLAPPPPLERCLLPPWLPDRLPLPAASSANSGSHCSCTRSRPRVWWCTLHANMRTARCTPPRSCSPLPPPASPAAAQEPARSWAAAPGAAATAPALPAPRRSCLEAQPVPPARRHGLAWPLPARPAPAPQWRLPGLPAPAQAQGLGPAGKLRLALAGAASPGSRDWICGRRG